MNHGVEVFSGVDDGIDIGKGVVTVLHDAHVVIHGVVLSPVAQYGQGLAKARGPGLGQSYSYYLHTHSPSVT